MRLFIGTGVDGLHPDGYTTVDIDPANKPDIVADASSLTIIESSTCEEVYASHVLEHIPWPHAVSAITEWARVLRPGGTIKISVPDMELLARMLARAQNPWHVMASIYGGHWTTPGGPQGHHYGYTRSMLVEVLGVLGFEQFDHWNSTFREAANGWLYSDNGEQLGLSINVSAIKSREPFLDTKQLIERLLRRDVMQPFMAVVREVVIDGAAEQPPKLVDAELFQRLHMRYLSELRRSEHLEQRVRELEAQRSASAMRTWARGTPS